ncbi:MAG: IS5 family transposase [Candidatus Methanoplasma sp.]|jgi:transposase|nr:IS5 family transposase [Candidatus Methanoplasma sp.]
MTEYNSTSKVKKATAQNKAKKKRRTPTYRENKADNEASVRTCSKLFNISSWMNVIEDELGSMNEGKCGRPYIYCTSMMLWIIAIMGYNKEMTLRKAAGTACGILASHGLDGPHYSTILRRAGSIVRSAVYEEKADWMISSYVRPNTGFRKHNIAVDSTGLNLSKTTLWRENKWGTGPDRRGWLKVHTAVDIDSGEILAYILTDDSVGDNRAFIPLMKMLLEEQYSIRTVYADNAYEAIDNWIFLDKEKIRFVVKFRSDTVGRSNGCMARGESAQLWVQLGEKKWKKFNGYGRRWKVECVFSDLKRLTAETVSATTPEGAEREVLMKILAYNTHKRIRADVISITRNNVLVAED